MVESGSFVMPGTELGFSEEFIPGDGAYEENGLVYAAVTGILNVDMKERKITVAPRTSAPPALKDGDVIVGMVADVKAQLAIVDIIKIRGNDRLPPGEISGSIHISQTRDTYVADISKEFTAGDIVYARVLNTNRSPIQLSTVDKEMGVIKAFCYRCNTPLSKEDSKLKCSDCGRTELRRISTEYGKGRV